MKDNKIALQETILLVSGFVALIAAQLIFQRPPFYDEDDYLSNVAILHQYGFGKNYLINLAGSAGPLYSMIHFLFEPLTGLQAPYVRWVNLGFLIGVTCITYSMLSLLNHSNRFYALYVMAIPMTYIIGGLALTEMPALFFLIAAIYLIINSQKEPFNKTTVIKLVIAGCCMGFAVIGRQPYLLIVFVFPILFISKEVKRKILLLAITIIFSVALPCYVFIIWNGLVPTNESKIYRDIALAGVSYRPDFFLLCIFYFSVTMLLIAPRFFRLPQSRNSFLQWVASFILLTAANLTFRWIELLPAKSLLEKIFTTPLQIYIFTGICGSVVIFASIYFMVCIFTRLHELKYPKELLFFAAAILMIAVSCSKITCGFSSLYAAQAIPLLIALGSFFYRESKYNPVRIIIGATIGLLSLISYLAGK